MVGPEPSKFDKDKALFVARSTPLCASVVHRPSRSSPLTDSQGFKALIWEFLQTRGP